MPTDREKFIAFTDRYPLKSIMGFWWCETRGGGKALQYCVVLVVKSETRDLGVEFRGDTPNALRVALKEILARVPSAARVKQLCESAERSKPLIRRLESVRRRKAKREAAQRRQGDGERG